MVNTMHTTHSKVIPFDVSLGSNITFSITMASNDRIVGARHVPQAIHLDAFKAFSLRERSRFLRFGAFREIRFSRGALRDVYLPRGVKYFSFGWPIFIETLRVVPGI